MSIEKIITCIIGGIVQGIATGMIIKTQVHLHRKKFNFLLFIFMCLYGIISLLFIKNDFRFFTTLLFLSFVMYFILKIKSRNVILYSFNVVILLSIAEIIITSILVLIGIDSKKIVNNYFYNLLTNILVSLFSIFVSLLPFFRKIMKKIIKKFIENKKLNNYLCFFLFIIYLVVSKNGLELILKYNYYMNILFIFGIVLIVTIVIKNELKYEQLTEENKQMLNYVTKYERIITDQGKTNHEFKNQLMVIRGYAQMNSPRLMEYLDSIVDDTKKAHSSYLISQLNKFPDGGIKGLLYYKLSIMDDEKIKYDINVETGVKTKLNSLNTVMYKNITKILGVLLDNAIDASKKSKEKKITISVCKQNSLVIFNIYNTYNGKIDIKKIGTGYTTKGSGHGYGLRLVKDIVEENKVFNIENSLEDGYYVSRLSIKISKRKKK